MAGEGLRRRSSGLRMEVMLAVGRHWRHELKAATLFGPVYLGNKFIRAYPSRKFSGFRTKRAGDPELHVLTSDYDYRMAIWSVLSYYLLSGRHDPLVVHDDGTLSDGAIGKIRRYFPECKIIRRTEADAVVAERFAGFPLLLALRRRLPHILKLTDFFSFCEAGRFLIVDSDVLFFSDPTELTSPATDGSFSSGQAHRFSEDVRTVYVVDPGEVRARTGVGLAPRINCGLGNVWKAAIDFGMMEWFLGTGLVDLGSCAPCVDQTLWALECERNGFDYLPASYRVATTRGTDGLVAKHYVALNLDRFHNARDYFFTEGIPAVRALLGARGCHGRL